MIFNSLNLKRFCEIQLTLKLFFAGHLFTQVLEKNDLYFFINPHLVVVAVDDFFSFLVVIFFFNFCDSLSFAYSLVSEGLYKILCAF